MSANSGLSLVAAITLAAVLVAAYSVVGGLLADAVTDVIQGVAVVVGLVLLGAIVATHVGGISGGPGPGRARAAAAASRRCRPARHAGAARHPDLRHDRGRGADLALSRRAQRARWPATAPCSAAAIVSGGRPDSGLPRADGAAQHRHGAGSRSRSCRGWRRSSCRACSMSPSSAPSSRRSSRPFMPRCTRPASQISHNIIVRLVPGLTDRGKLWSRAPHRHGAQHRRLPPLRDLATHP